MNLFNLPSFIIFNFLSCISIFNPPAVKVPQNITFLEFWVIFIKPPQPAILGPNLLTLIFPFSSHCARPGNAISRPSPS